jgi:hypothetical protein
LYRCRYEADTEDRALMQEQVRAEVALSSHLLAVLADIGHGEASELLRRALGGEIASSRDRIFYLLSFSYERQAILQARDNLALASADKRAYALEVLDVLLARDVKRFLFPLLTDLPARQKVQQMSGMFPQPQRTRCERLIEIVASPTPVFSPWTQACAVYASIPEAKREPAAGLDRVLAAAFSSPHPLVRETAAWARKQLGRPASVEQEDTMLSTIEKVIALKQASIFAETPDETLAEIAAVLQELALPAGKTLFEKGERGDSMYLIVDGEVRVHDGGHTLNHLHTGDVFGEMAVLDAEPRMASVTAVEDSQLLRLAQEPLSEVMADRSEVAQGIIRVLSRHLRARAGDLDELRARLEAAEQG